MTSASGFFSHIVFSAGVSLLHAYLSFLWTPRSFPYCSFFYEPVFHFHAKSHCFLDFSLWVSSHTLSSLQVFPFTMPILHSYGLQDFFHFFFLRTSFSLPCQKPPWSWLQPLVSSHTLSSLQVFPFSMPILHSYGLQGLFRVLFTFLTPPPLFFGPCRPFFSKYCTGINFYLPFIPVSGTFCSTVLFHKFFQIAVAQWIIFFNYSFLVHFKCFGLLAQCTLYLVTISYFSSAS